jgi:hypothetical protein
MQLSIYGREHLTARSSTFANPLVEDGLWEGIQCALGTVRFAML